MQECGGHGPSCSRRRKPSVTAGNAPGIANEARFERWRCASVRLQAGETALQSAGVSKLRFPCVGFMKAAGEDSKPGILVQADNKRLLYFAAGSQAPQILPLS